MLDFQVSLVDLINLAQILPQKRWSTNDLLAIPEAIEKETTNKKYLQRYCSVSAFKKYNC